MGDLLTLIKSLRLEKRYTDTLAACDRALRIEPTSAEVWRTKGDVLSLIGDYSKALDAYNHVLAQHPMDISVLHSKISVLNRLGRGQEASELTAQLIRHQASIDLDWANQQLSKVPNDGEAWRKKALALLTLQRYQEALDALYHVPVDTDHWSMRSNVLRELGRNMEADEAYKEFRRRREEEDRVYWRVRDNRRWP